MLHVKRPFGPLEPRQVAYAENRPSDFNVAATL